MTAYERNRSIIAEELQRYRGHCAYHGCADTRRIEWHHVDPETRLFRIARVGGRREESVRAELAKCVPLCLAHHRKTHVELDLNRKPDDGRGCEHCNGSMRGKRPDARFCTRKCQDTAKHQRARERKRSRSGPSIELWTLTRFARKMWARLGVRRKAL